MREVKYEIKPGDRFGKLTIIEEDFDAAEEEYKRNKINGIRGKHKHYLCMCDCGKTTTVVKGSLTKGATTSCGCGRSGIKIGNKYGDLTVVGLSESYEKMAGKKNGKHKYFDCVCDACGKTSSVRSSDLASGKKTDCGCRNGERISNGCAINLVGMEFGHLHVIKRDTGYYKSGVSGRHARWICNCDICNSVTSVSSNMLIRNGKDRCSFCSGKSNGEMKILEIFNNTNVNFEDEVTFDTCVYPDTGRRLIFDFVVYKNGGEISHIVEYDGIQHFKKIRLWDMTTSLDERVKRDKFKNEWCASNNIPIIRIPYTRLASIEYADLMPDTSDFLVSN